MRRLAILLVLLLPSAASASDGALLDARGTYLPAAEARYANTPEGAQARYEAGRNLVEAVLAAGPVSAGRRALRADLLARGRAQVARAEGLDRGDGFRSAAPLAPLPGAERRGRPAPSGCGSRAAPGSGCGEGERGCRDLGPRARLRALCRLSSGLAFRGRIHGQDRRAGRGAPRVAEARAQPVVVRRAPDRLLVVEPRREQDRRRARLRRGRGRSAPARHDRRARTRARTAPRPRGGRRGRTRA